MVDDWRTNRAQAEAALQALQAAMDGAGVPGSRQIRLMMGALNDIQIGGLTVAAAGQLARALEGVSRQRTVPDTGDEPDHA